jgi:myosin heavy subunit
MKGATTKQLDDLCLTTNGKVDMSVFEYLANSDPKFFDVAKIDDIALYKEVVESFETMKFTEDEQKVIWQITASCLILGNLHFDDKNFDDSKLMINFSLIV